MPSPPPSPFVLPPDGWRGRLERLLAGVGGHGQRVAIAFVAVVALVAAGVLWLRATPQAADPPGLAASGEVAGQHLPRVQPGAGAPAAGPAGGVGPGGLPGAGPAGVAAGQLAVDVVGQVRDPGLVRLPVGSRVQDAIEAAGGPAPGAQLDAVNLARKLVDGEQIRVPRKGERIPTGAGGAGPGGAGQAGAPPGPGASAQPGVPLDLNTATVEQLDALPGVGEVTASRIVAYRDQHPFTAVEDLRQVPGIGDRRFEMLKDLVTVSGAPSDPGVP